MPKTRVRAIAAGFAGAIALSTVTLLQPSASADVQPMIIGGHDATEDYSFMASLQRNGRHNCGASLIAPEWVVTAAHCVPSDGSVTGLKLRIGSKTVDGGGELVDAAKVSIHPDYGSGKPGGDLAVVKLAKAVQAKPIAIASETGPAGTPTRILGWGTTKDGDQVPPKTLQELDTKKVEDDNCVNFAPGNEICTDSDTENAMGCFGDSDGPQLKGKAGAWELVGATSRDGDSDPKCSTGTGIWTDVPSYVAWVKEQTGIK
ncbi:trypsin [Herbihabitans rhizosphaerae]|uniref:Trypsin n=1 Tax=Herbihabitans rhizosphaerae TaxID=1872711 RepID=A0A4Q7L7S2_9PSEU|nr:serine protease [Herbihabitans rhizosphaerae]RZS44950.1 trypsin [Herbihabitans rhizosphaerae]